MKEQFNALDLPVLAFSVKAVVKQDILWNSFPGSVVHGNIGFRLKKLSCVVKHQNCQKCFLVHSCPYGVVFESPIPADSKRMRLYPQSPHPMRITVFPWEKQVLVPEETFEINCYLFGRATTSLMLILLALDESLREGVGRMSAGKRGLAEIVTIKNIINDDIKQWDDLKTNYAGFIDTTSLYMLAKEIRNTDALIELKTPLKLITDGRVNNNPTVRDILANLLRRLSNMSYFFGGKDADLEYEKLLEMATSLTSENELRKIRAIRYSSRQEKAIDISGIIGKMNILDCPPAILSLLQMGQFAGIGKNTSMGLGDYIID
ncbi:MAG: hypothetical protein CVT49_07790 [candidate division Zixibacteria bacterium HGW-Zixibacteria-1]|nr:MAG: hypothetical protein CVT49_07790 [candidate division Zixibacteria bacterium HGW-Zixibacteria-1]